MNRKTFTLIILLTTLALLGIIFIQFYWFNSTMQLKAEQFDEKVKVSLKSIVNQVYESNSDSVLNYRICHNERCNPREISSVTVEPQLLDSLINSEFREMKMNPPFIYAIYNYKSGEIFQISDTTYIKEIRNTPHKVNITCLSRNDAIMLGVWFPDEKNRVLFSVIGWLLSCFALILLLVYGIYYTINSFLKQKKISEMKTDFVKNMTHEFKTPIATISLASEMLLNPSISGSVEKSKKYAGIIHNENNRLQAQVDQVLHLAVLDQGNFSINSSEFDINELVTEAGESFKLNIADRNGSLNTITNASPSIVYADELHTRNIINNLLENANKYSPDKPDITIITENTPSGIEVIVEDKGSGISSEEIKHIFKKFYRVPTGNVHNLKGFGLGLFYVQTLIEAMGGHISVESTVNKGSKFRLVFPQSSINMKENSAKK